MISAQHTVDLGDLHALLQVRGRQDGGQASGDHGLAAPRRTDEQQVMPSCHRHFRSPADMLLSPDIPVVQAFLQVPGRQKFPFLLRRDPAFSPQIISCFRQRLHSQDTNPFRQSSLGCIFFWQDTGVTSHPAGLQHNGKDPRYLPDPSVQAQLPDHQSPGKLSRVVEIQGSHHRQGNGKVEGSPSFAKGCRGQVDHDPFGRKLGPGIPEGRPHPGRRLLHLRRQIAHHMEDGQPVAHIRLHLHRFHCKSLQGGGQNGTKCHCSTPFFHFLSVDFFLPYGNNGRTGQI